MAEQPPTTPASREPAGAPGTDWRRLHLWQIQPVRDLLVLAGAAGLLHLGYRLSLVTVPMLLALALAYLFEPVVRRLTRSRHVSRSGAAVLIIAVAALAIVVPATLAVGFAVAQGADLAGRVLHNVTVLNDARVMEDPEEAREMLRRGVRGHTKTWIRLHDLIRSAEESGAGAGTPPHEPPPDASGAGATDPDAEAPAPDSENPPEEPGENGLGIGQAVAENVEQDFGRLLGFLMVWIENNAGMIGRQAVGTGAQAVNAAARTLGSVGLFVFSGFLTAFFFFFFSTGYGRVLAFWESLIPERRKGRVIDLLRQMDRVIAGFVRGRLTICAVQCVFFTLGYWLIGVPAPLVIGPLVGLLSIVPYLGLLGVPISLVALWLNPPAAAWQQHWWWILFAPIVIYWLGQALDDYVLTPLIQGRSTNLDTPTIVFASLAGGVLAGVYGLLLAIPIAACLKILAREVFWPRFQQWARGGARDFLPIGRQ